MKRLTENMLADIRAKRRSTESLGLRLKGTPIARTNGRGKPGPAGRYIANAAPQPRSVAATGPWADEAREYFKHVVLAGKGRWASSSSPYATYLRNARLPDPDLLEVLHDAYSAQGITDYAFVEGRIAGFRRVELLANLARREMPQVEDLDALREHLEAAGVPVEEVDLKHDQLQASQDDLNRAKVAKLRELGPAELKKKRVLASEDGYVIDGHHRAAALREEDPDGTVPALRVGLPKDEAIEAVKKFPGCTYRGIRDGAVQNAEGDFDPSQHPKGPDGKWVDSGGGQSVAKEHTPKHGGLHEVPIHVVYKGQKHDAVLVGRTHVRLASGEVLAPSAAAAKITGGKSINGWKWWKYEAESGEHHEIQKLATAPPKKKLMGAPKAMEELIDQGKSKGEIEEHFKKKYAEIGGAPKESWLHAKLADLHAQATGEVKTSWAKTKHVAGVTKTAGVTVSEGTDVALPVKSGAPAHAPPPPPPALAPTKPAKPPTKAQVADAAAKDAAFLGPKAADPSAPTMDEKKVMGAALAKAVASFPSSFKIQEADGSVSTAKIQPYALGALDSGSKVDPKTGAIKLKVVGYGPSAGADHGHMGPGDLQVAIDKAKDLKLTPPKPKPGHVSREFESTVGWVTAGRAPPPFGEWTAHHHKMMAEQGSSPSKESTLLSSDEYHAMKNFTGFDSGSINAACNADLVGATPQMKAKIAALDSAIAKAKPFEAPIEVLRGLHLGEADIAAWCAAADAGKLLKFQAFSSTSTTHPFGGNVQLTMKTTMGLAVHGSVPHEHEVLMGRGWYYKVYSYERSPNGLRMHVEVLGPDPNGTKKGASK